MITARRFEQTDADEVAKLVANTMRTTNAKDYSQDYIENELKHLTARDLIARARYFHCYVLLDGQTHQIVAVGSIGPYWGSKVESSLFNIFVAPTYQGQGIGRKLIETLEQDTYFKRAKRIEIPASITGLGFYQKMGYQFKNGNAALDDEQLYRLEKFN
ncbi:GNAT family N-acetyltransferase [Lactiplantibacillus pentosus]|uniref:GNAT family N-acetyltransferase n=1 Tax=Lactiplantibacillus pentosus TaxID=1589 RepID=UPI000D01DAEC|nr:GNAT family N-acetyltransferase [Lactiplantibacillus pentosus]PRO85280.1 GNAT family N-acetyltransferase [Lactiplantibacillus pentosus]